MRQSDCAATSLSGCATSLLLRLAQITLALTLGGGVCSATTTTEVEHPIPAPTRPWEAYYGVAVQASGQGYVVGEKGLLLKSSDRGRTWRRERLMSGRKKYDLYSIGFTPDGTSGWIVGEQGTIFHSSDGGQGWQPQKSGVTDRLLKIAVIDEQRVSAVGSHGTLLSTSDSGGEWHLFKYKQLTFFDVAFQGPECGFAVGEFETILRTCDSGRTWKVVHGSDVQDFNLGPYFAIAPGRDTHVFVAGFSGGILTTDDDGNTWQEQRLSDSIPVYYAATGSVGADGWTVWLAGRAGLLTKLTEDSQTTVSTGIASDISSLAFAGEFGLAVGLGGAILRTDDSGGHWQQVSSAGLVSSHATNSASAQDFK